MWNQHGSVVLFISVLDTQCFYNQSKSYANFISADKSQNSIEHQSAALTRGRINTNKTQHGIPFQISLIHEAPQPSVHAERPASSPLLLPWGICRRPERASTSKAPSPHREALQTHTLHLQIPARRLPAPKLGPSNKTHSGAQSGFPVNSTCRTTLLYPSRLLPPTRAPWSCHLEGARSLDLQDRNWSFQFHPPGGLSEEVEMCIVTKFNPEPRALRSSPELCE